MEFLAPLFLAGLVGVGLPLWLHMLRQAASNMDHVLCPADKPLDAALREYLTIRQGRL